MQRKIESKLHSCKGMSWAVLLLLLPILVLLILILWPSWQRFRFQSQQIGCNAALATARSQLTIDYIANNQNPTATEARELVGQVMDGWQDLCPAGGTVYLVETETGEPPYTLICGLHDTDTAYCTRLNADYALTQLEQALQQLRKQQNILETAQESKAKLDSEVSEQESDAQTSSEFPEQLPVTFNGHTCQAVQVTEDQNLRRGTATTAGLEGTVIYFAVMGESDFCRNCGAEPGTICYFGFADENHCANWRYDTGWTGDSYETD